MSRICCYAPLAPATHASSHVVEHAAGSIWATDVPGWITAIATAGLLVGAIVTAIYAVRAFRKQSQEVSVIEQQVKDQQEVTNQQAKLLEVQSGQLDLQRQQLDDQRHLNAKQSEVLELQADELRESLVERKREAAEQRKAQASMVFIWQYAESMPPRGPTVTAHVRNISDQPIYNPELRWHRGTAGHGDPNPEPLPTIMPGDEIARGRQFPPDTNMDVSGAVVRFTDAAGVRWLRRPDGYLNEFPAT